ncbi:MAG: ABC transporter permease [Chloroflexi bacterium]|nr:ABC transporter permease [Chloroflexota bacterium]
MNIKLKKALSDLTTHPGRTALVILALVIGLWGVGSILVSYAVLRNDLNENYARTNPAHVVMTSQNFDRLDLAAFRNRPGIASAEFRNLSFQRIEVFPDQWIPLWVFGVEDFNNFNLAQFYNEEGNKVPEPGTMLIERDGQNVSDLKIGTLARVRVGGQTIEVPITGIAFDPAQAPATQDAFIYAYVDKKTYTAITGEPANQRLIFRLENVTTKQDIQTIANTIVDEFEQLGITVETVSIPKPNEHPHQFQLNTLLALQGSIGGLAFLMGAVLVSQLMSAILTQQVRQIGVLKAIGASRWGTLKIYLAMVLIFGAVSSAIAIPLAVMSGYAFAEFVANTINFEVLTTTLPLAVYVYLIVAGLLLPILVSLPALLKGVNVSVQDVLSDYGIRPGRSDSAAVARLPLSNSLILAVRNTLRRRKRLAVTVATMALGVAIFNTGFNVRQALIVFLAENRNSMKHDVQVVLKNQIPLEQALAPFSSVSNISRVEAWNGGRGRLQSGRISTTNGIGVVALPYDTDLALWEVIEGRWLAASDETEIVMNQIAAETFGDPVVGEHYTIDIKGKLVNAKLVGIVKEFEVAKIYMDKDRYDALVNPGHLVNSLMFVAQDKDYKQIIALKKDIENAIASSDLDILYVLSQAERAEIIFNHLNIILTLIVFLSLLVLVVSTLGMASATGINIMERTREIGVLRAIGATPKMIYGLFVAEGMVVSVVSILVGLLLAWPLSIAASAFFGDLILGNGVPLDFAFSNLGFGITLVVTLVFGWLASRVPARRAITVSTREAIAYE